MATSEPNIPAHHHPSVPVLPREGRAELFVRHPGGGEFMMLTKLQADGKACIRCGADVTSREYARPVGQVAGWGAVWAHDPNCPVAS